MPTMTSAPWIDEQARELLAQRGHGWLLQGPSGLGQLELALSLVRAWLCERPGPTACGSCESCHGIDVHTHADLCVLMPETTLLELGWPLDEKAQKDIDDKKRKPSKEIRIEAMREAVHFCQRTSARGRGKAVLVFPAERMNPVTANALLKTLEEPPGDVRFMLATQAAHLLLPTIRSRCLTHTMRWPETAASLDWLQSHGLTKPQAEALLRVAGGRPEDALAQQSEGALWRDFPKAMRQGDVAHIKDWSGLALVDALQKLCADGMALSVGASPRFFSPDQLPAKLPALPRLSAWSRALVLARQSAEHPYNAGLMQEALVSQAQAALNDA